MVYNQICKIKVLPPAAISNSSKIGYVSQFFLGGLLCRGMAQTMDDHNIINFIALSSPLNGQYGGTHYMKDIQVIVALGSLRRKKICSGWLSMLILYMVSHRVVFMSYTMYLAVIMHLSFRFISLVIFSIFGFCL